MSLRALVVDPHHGSGFATASALTMRGYTSRVAATLAESISIVGTFLPSLILCDVVRRDGTMRSISELRSRAFQIGFRPTIIALSCIELPSFRDASFDGFLLKPIEWRELQTVLATVHGDGA